VCDFQTIAFGIRVAAQGREIEPLMSLDQIKLYITAHTIHETKLIEGIRRAP
jgi:hypothetical protein